MMEAAIDYVVVVVIVVVWTRFTTFPISDIHHMTIAGTRITFGA